MSRDRGTAMTVMIGTGLSAALPPVTDDETSTKKRPDHRI